MSDDRIAGRDRRAQRDGHGDVEAITALYTPDCRGWASGQDIGSREELIEEASRRGIGLSDIRVEAEPVELPGRAVAAEWRLTARHTGPLRLAEDVEIEATGRTLTLRGAMFADVSDGRISGFRQYWDESDLLEQLGLIES